MTGVLVITVNLEPGQEPDGGLETPTKTHIPNHNLTSSPHIISGKPLLLRDGPDGGIDVESAKTAAPNRRAWRCSSGSNYPGRACGETRCPGHRPGHGVRAFQRAGGGVGRNDGEVSQARQKLTVALLLASTPSEWTLPVIADIIGHLADAD